MSVTHKKVFVTVGTTEFDQLIRHADTAKFRQALTKLGYTHLVMQIGRGEYVPITKKQEDESFDGLLQFEVYRFKASLQEDMKSADLVISHAGAGSCLEVLKLRKASLLVVINDELMHNHQSELAERLAEDKHALCAMGPSGLQKLLELPKEEFHANLSALKPYQVGHPAKLKHFLDSILGDGVRRGHTSSVLLSGIIYSSLGAIFLALHVYN